MGGQETDKRQVIEESLAARRFECPQGVETSSRQTVCVRPVRDIRKNRSKVTVEAASDPTYVRRMLFTKLDTWVGKTLFIPPIIRFCQATRQSQFAVSRFFWFVAALDGFYRAETLFSSVLW